MTLHNTHSKQLATVLRTGHVKSSRGCIAICSCPHGPHYGRILLFTSSAFD